MKTLDLTFPLLANQHLIVVLGKFIHQKEGKKSIMMNWQHRKVSRVINLICFRSQRKRLCWSLKLNAFESFKSIPIKIQSRLRSTGRPKRQPFISQTSSVTEAPSDEVEAEQEADEDVEPARVTK